jgi:hypothetical protein
MISQSALGCGYSESSFGQHFLNSFCRYLNEIVLFYSKLDLILKIIFQQLSFLYSKNEKKMWVFSKVTIRKK